MALVEVAGVLCGVEALMQQPGVGQLVDHAWVAHQVLHRPARKAQQAQQPAHHLWPFDQQRDVAVATQQGFEPVDEAQRGGLGAAVVGQAGCRPLDQLAQAQLGLVAQVLHPWVGAPDSHPLGQRDRQLVEQCVAVDGQWRHAALLAAIARLGRRRLAFMQQGIELGGHQLADLAQPV